MVLVARDDLRRAVTCVGVLISTSRCGTAALSSQAASYDSARSVCSLAGDIANLPIAKQTLQIVNVAEHSGSMFSVA